MRICHRLLPWAAQLVVSTALVACSTAGPKLAPSLDPASGEMVVALRSAVVFTRAEPGLSPAARDYVYLGPVETNVAGLQALYLWVGLAGTIDRPGLAVAPRLAESLALQVGEQTIELMLQDWHDDMRDSPFDITVPLQQSMRAEVTPEQLQQIAQAQQLSISLIDPSGEARVYRHWSGATAEWHDAPEDAEVGFAVRVRTPLRP